MSESPAMNAQKSALRAEMIKQLRAITAEDRESLSTAYCSASVLSLFETLVQLLADVEGSQAQGVHRDTQALCQLNTSLYLRAFIQLVIRVD
jgi:hypothetical protein